jgi:site-specific DNA-methyltransferase (adenine-specific)
MSRFHIGINDAVAFLAAMPDESIDLVVTDPAYESLEKHRSKGTTTRLKMSDGSSNEWFDIFPNGRFPEFFEQVYRVLKRNSHFYMYCDQETMFVAKPMAEAAGFKFWKPLIWEKVSIGMGYHYRARYELILFFEKGKRRLADLGIADVITQKRIRDGYPTQKPVEVSEVLIKQSSQPGELVVDPFMGSASVGIAALKNDRAFMGTDTSPNAYALSGQRLAAVPGAERAEHTWLPRRVTAAQPEQRNLFETGT